MIYSFERMGAKLGNKIAYKTEEVIRKILRGVGEYAKVVGTFSFMFC